MPIPKKASTVEIKSFVVAQRWGTLSTLSLSQNGYPFGSLVPYDIDDAGNFIIYVSLIAEHFKNLKADPRASLMVLDPFGISDPQAHARATVLLDFEVIPESAREKALVSYEARFPNSINYEIAHNFLFMRGIPRGVRWIGGFGDIQWVDSEKFSQAAPDILAYDAYSIISHMNTDHRDALKDFVMAHSKSDGPIEEPKIVSLQRETFVIRHGKDSQFNVEIPFVTAVNKAEDVRRIMIETLIKARAAIAASK